MSSKPVRREPTVVRGTRPEPATGRRPRVLIVDDEPQVRGTLAALLEAEGYGVVAVPDGEEAMAHLSEVDLVLLDAMLPGRDGWQVCRDIKANDPFVPVLMVTARTSPRDVVRTFEAGADDYIAKPFNAAELAARIGTRLRVHDVERELRRANVRLRELADQNYRLYEKARADAEERARLLRELDHRVRNNLSVLTGLVGMERNRRPQRSPAEALASLENRFRSFLIVFEESRAHGYGGVQLDSLIERLVLRLRQSMDPDGLVTVRLDCAPFAVSEKQAFALALIVNELATNAFIHAFRGGPGRLRIATALEPEGMVLEVEDDGVGGAGGEIPPGRVGSGRSIVEALAEGELGGRIRFLVAERGTRVVLTCPMAADRDEAAVPERTERSDRPRAPGRDSALGGPAAAQ